MNEKKREIRTIDCKLAIRETAHDAEGESRTITGTAIVFDSESEILDDWGTRFREIIKPDAATMTFLNSQDIKMNLLHDRDLTIARANKGVGNLRLSVDEKGVNFEFDAPKCDIGDRALELVRNGVYSGCSFEFYPQDYTIEEVGDNITVTHTRFKAITALTIGMDPAYSQTSVNARELVKPSNAEDNEEKTREIDEEKNKKEKLEREMLRRARTLKRISSDIDF